MILKSFTIQKPLRLLPLGLLLLALNAQGKTLTWPGVVKAAQEKNEDLKAAEGTLQASEFAVSASYSGYLPTINATAGYSQVTNETGAGSINEKSYSAGLNASQELFSGFKDSARIDQAKGQRDLSRINLQVTRAKVSYDLKSAYASLVYAQKAVKMSQDIRMRRENNLRLVELRFENGRENKGAVLLSKAYLEQAKLDLLQAQQNLGIAQTQLGKILGEPTEETLVVEDGVPVLPPKDTVDFQSLAINMPAYLQSQVQEEIANADVTLARGGFFPTLSVSAQTGDSGPNWYPENNRWSIGATLTLPLFNGGKDYYGTKSSLESRKVASLQKESSLKTGLVNLKQTHAAYTQAVQKLITDKAFFDALSVREVIAKEQYNNGLLTFNDWDIIENDLVTRQKNVLQSERDRVIAEAAWEQTLGRGVFHE
jgi:outer membrane protein TolC